MNIKKLIGDYINSEVEDLEEEGALALEMCEDEGDYHITSYWIQAVYTNAENFFNKSYSEALIDEVIQMYPNDINKLISKIKRVYGTCETNRLSLECLATMVLIEMQKCSIWYSVYGSEEEDMLDFNKYNITNALNDKDEFPVMKQSDLVAAMYGINTTVQPSDLYDVFAHYADELKMPTDEYLESESIFTPDVFYVAGVVARYKNYTDLSKTLCSDIALKFNSLCNIENEELRYIYILSEIIEDYYNRFSTTPNGLPLHNDMVDARLVKLNGEYNYKIKYSIRGIKDKKTCWDSIATEIYKVPVSPTEFQSLIVQIALDFKRELNGLEKVRNKDIAAIDGKYPNRFSASHGLTFVKDINTHYKDKRGNDCIKEPTINFSLSLAEKQSLYVIKKSLRYAKENPVLSCSFGIDSITTLHLLRRVNKHNYKIVFNNSRVEYPELIKYKKKISELWNLNDKIVETKPIESYWELLSKNGWNFERKGDRRGKGKSNSEECCNKIKHIPMYNVIDKFIEDGTPMQVNYTGLRAFESRARSQALKRDNVVYFAKSWKSIRVNPIGWYSNQMVWDYVKKYNIPYCEVYDMKLYYEDVYDNVNEDEIGKVYYAPRIGCWTCMINASRGYLQFMKKFYPKQYEFMMFKKGLARTLFEKGAKKMGILTDNISIEKPIVKKSDNQISMFDESVSEISIVEKNNDQMSFFIEENVQAKEKEVVMSNDDILDQYPLEAMENMIMRRPCKFLV